MLALINFLILSLIFFVNHASWLSIVGLFTLLVIIRKVIFHFLLSNLMCGDPPLQTLCLAFNTMTFVDDSSHATWVYLLKNKSDVCAAFKSLHSTITTQFNTKLRVLQSDNDEEHLSRKFSFFLSTSGIIHQTTCPGTPKQNGVAKHKNRHLLEIAWAIMFTMNVSRTFWSEVIHTVVYLINRMSSRVVDHNSPVEILFPNSSLFPLPPKTFGCICYVHVPKSNRTKLDPKALKCVFLGYGVNQKGYKCFHPSTRHYFVSRCDIFLVHSFLFFTWDISSGGAVCKCRIIRYYSTFYPHLCPNSIVLI